MGHHLVPKWMVGTQANAYIPYGAGDKKHPFFVYLLNGKPLLCSYAIFHWLISHVKLLLHDPQLFRKITKKVCKGIPGILKISKL